jgi:hypothetical protein
VAEAIALRQSFDQSARYHIEVAAISDFESTLVARDYEVAERFAVSLARKGFQTTTRAWNYKYYAALLQARALRTTVYVFYRPTNAELLPMLNAALRDFDPNVDLQSSPVAKAAAQIGVPETALVNSERHASVLFYLGAS